MSKSSPKQARDLKEPVKSENSLENIYKQYLQPMPLDDWQKVQNLSQPTLLKRVPARTVYSSAE